MQLVCLGESGECTRPAVTEFRIEGLGFTVAVPKYRGLKLSSVYLEVQGTYKPMITGTYYAVIVTGGDLGHLQLGQNYLDPPPTLY